MSHDQVKSDLSTMEVEHVNDMCGGYTIVTKGNYFAVCRYNESPLDALERVKREKPNS